MMIDQIPTLLARHTPHLGSLSSQEMSFVQRRVLPNVVMFPNWKGQRIRGVEQAPTQLIKVAGVHPTRRSLVWCGENLIENLKSLHFINKSLLKDISQGYPATDALRDHSQKNRYDTPLINVGGDHSMSIATVAATLSVHPRAKVLWVGAHADLNTFSASLTKNYNEMALSHISGLESHSESHFPYITESNQLDLSNRLMYVGIRDVDELEAKTIAEYNIPFISVRDFHTDLYASLIKIINWTRGHPVHLSFDVNAIDPLELISTGRPRPDGLSVKNAYMLSENLRMNANVVNIDIAELNPLIGTQWEQSKSLAAVHLIFRNYISSPIIVD